MKKFLLITACLLFSLGLKAQQTDSKNSDTTIYSRVETEPEFPGGLQKLYQFVTSNLKTTGDKGRVFLVFVVEKDGSLTHIKAVKSLSEKADKEAIRVMYLSPKWKPATMKGQLVRVNYTIPISFN